MRELRVILSAAVKNLIANGFDDERVKTWSARLLGALSRTLLPVSFLRARLRMALSRELERVLTPAQIARRHRGVSRFTLKELAPQMQRELTQRIAASADLITLNREASIRRTLQRFQGWASAIPLGGTTRLSVSKETQLLRRHFASLPFEERRVIIDQGHKLVSSVNSIIAENGGAITARWHSHWRELNYDYRPAHKTHDGQLFVLRDNWALKAGLMKLAGRPYTDQLEQPAELPFCRCYYEYVYKLASLPEEMLTVKGRRYLLQNRRAA